MQIITRQKQQKCVQISIESNRNDAKNVCVNLIALAVVLQTAGALTVASFAVPTFDFSQHPTSNFRPEGIWITNKT